MELGFSKQIRLISSDLIEGNIGFDCGDQVFNEYLLKKAINDLEAVTYLFLDNMDESRIVGYFSLSCSCIVVESSKSKTQYPAVEISMLALDKRYQKKVYQKEVSSEDCLTYSDILISTAIDTVRVFTDKICGATHITLYSLNDEKTLKFYKRNGFEDYAESFFKKSNFFSQKCVPLFLEM